MSSEPEKTNSVPPANAYALANRRRRESKDSLLADEPPRALGVAIALVGVLLCVAVYAGWSIQYEQTLPVSLELKVDESSRSVYGLTYLDAGQMTQVHTGQLVEVELASYPAERYGWIAGKVGAESAETRDGLHVVRVDLAAGAVTNKGFHPILDNVRQGQGKIVVERVKLLARVFSA
ncbi:MAG TPA: hypothetical protein VJX67_02070, partial [Blastocatellia bacterium]|nr:hypothetical protein [Blastocatellia bacterium]